MYSLLVDQFDVVYARALEESKVHLSEQTRLSVRRTIFCVLEPRIREVKEEGIVIHGLRVKGFDDFCTYLRAEIRRELDKFLKAGILNDLE